MAWEIKFVESALKDIKKLARQDQEKIISYLRNKVSIHKDPKVLGKPLGNTKAGLWRYRVEKYRIICQIQNNEMTVLVLKVGKRDKVYD